MAAPKSFPSTERSRSDKLAQSLSQSLAKFLDARLTTGQRLCVGLSGGRDSLVMLHALSRLALPSGQPFRLSALHVHHGLSPHADDWADFCAEFCRACAVPLDIVRVDVPRSSGEGLEAAARRLRHQVFSHCAADWLALAHHRDDQAETVLLNLLRGAGLAGAAGMLAERPQARGPALIRPLLDAPRTLIEEYARDNGLVWIDDESNEDTHYRRNYLRREVMPGLAEKFPGAAQALARAASHFAEGAALLDALAGLDRVALAAAGGRIGLAGFNALSPPRARNLLRFELVSAGFRAPDARWIDEALRQLASAGGAAETCVATPDGALHVYRGELYPVLHRPSSPPGGMPWAGEAALPWAGGQVFFSPATGAGIDLRRLAGETLRLTARHGGERLQPDPRRPRRTLRNLLQERGVPPWERDRLPCLRCGERLLWVGGLGVDAAFACPPGEAGLQVFWAAEASSG